MKEFLKKYMSLITKSVSSENTVSSTRIQSYMILATVWIGFLILFGLEISNAVYTFRHDKPYVISNEIIVTFGLVLSHHLSILFSRSKSKNVSSDSGKLTMTDDTSSDNTTQTTDIK